MPENQSLMFDRFFEVPSLRLWAMKSIRSARSCFSEKRIEKIDATTKDVRGGGDKIEGSCAEDEEAVTIS